MHVCKFCLNGLTGNLEMGTHFQEIQVLGRLYVESGIGLRSNFNCSLPVFPAVFISVAARAILHPPALYFAQRPETTEPSDQ